MKEAAGESARARAVECSDALTIGATVGGLVRGVGLEEIRVLRPDRFLADGSSVRACGIPKSGKNRRTNSRLRQTPRSARNLVDAASSRGPAGDVAAARRDSLDPSFP